SAPSAPVAPPPPTHPPTGGRLFPATAMERADDSEATLHVSVKTLASSAHRAAAAPVFSLQGGMPEAWLVDIQQISGKKKHHLEEKVVLLGRKKPEFSGKFQFVPVPDAAVSREHASISWREGRFWLKDHASGNGVFLNGQRVVEEISLTDGDRIALGKIPMEFHVAVPTPPEDDDEEERTMAVFKR
ncbi:MAG: FHA domain-containing protein, partial [Magnetococcales bacterium]|nr:FHA domain-containing protein [Magnetococcales bacterium]